jgi:quercetin dioxygenase-like cupin family protein
VSEVSATATWTGSGKGEQLWFLGTLATIKVPGEASNGRFALIEFLFPRHASPPLHTHPQDESYIVQEGLLTVQAGEQRFELAPGAGAGDNYWPPPRARRSRSGLAPDSTFSTIRTL